MNCHKTWLCFNFTATSFWGYSLINEPSEPWSCTLRWFPMTDLTLVKPISPASDPQSNPTLFPTSQFIWPTRIFQFWFGWHIRAGRGFTHRAPPWNRFNLTPPLRVVFRGWTCILSLFLYARYQPHCDRLGTRWLLQTGLEWTHHARDGVVLASSHEGDLNAIHRIEGYE